jgi:hypothetical protein
VQLVSGTQDRLINETTLGAGSTVREFSIQSDAVLATLWVDSVASGTLEVNVYTLTDTGKEKLLFSFPSVSASTTSLLLKKSSICMQRVRLEAVYSGVCTYEVYCRAISTIGEASIRIVGSLDWSVDQVNVGTSPMQIIPVSLTDRQGLLVKNWLGGGILYIAESQSKLLAGKGYPLAMKDALAMDVAGGSELWGVSSSGTIDVRIVEAGGE